jgi:hypothetical protein
VALAGQVLNMADLLDCFSEKSSREAMVRLADQMLGSDLAKPADIRLVNVAIDSGTVQSLTAIHWIDSNSFCLD